jgi:copper resistance protein C
MRSKQGRFRVGTWVTALLFAATVLFVEVQIAKAHAILKETSPAANSVVKGPDVPIKLRYNVRIDAARSKLQLLMPDNSTTNLTIEPQPAPDVLTSKATGLKPGAYRVQWQVLAPDGHITRGQIPFSVAGS